MFNSTTSLSPNQQKNNNSSTSVITKGSTVKGDITSEENIRLDGKVIGEIHCKQRLVIGINGELEGTIATESADISGTIYGDIAVFGHLHIQSSAKIFGNIQAKFIKVGEGAVLEGECKVGQVDVKPRKEKPRIDLLTENSAPQKKKASFKPKVEQTTKQVAKPDVSKRNSSSSVFSTPSKKIVEKEEQVLVASTPQEVNPANRFFPEGEFQSTLSLEQEDNRHVEKPTKKANPVAVHETVKRAAPIKKTTRQFNAAKFNTLKKQPSNNTVGSEAKVKEEKKYGIKLPSISVKW